MRQGSRQAGYEGGRVCSGFSPVALAGLSRVSSVTTANNNGRANEEEYNSSPGV